MTLICTKCGSGSRIEHEGSDLHCKFCGNVVVEGVTPADVFPKLPDDLPVYKRTDFTDYLESLIAEKEKQLDALKTVLSIVREAA